MKIQLASTDPALIRQLEDEIPATLTNARLENHWSVSHANVSAAEPSRGDAVTVATIVLAAVSAGGAMTVGMGQHGFLTRLAKVLEAWVNRKIEVTVELEAGQKIHLSGSAGHIERILKSRLNL